MTARRWPRSRLGNLRSALIPMLIRYSPASTRRPLRTEIVRSKQRWKRSLGLRGPQLRLSQRQAGHRLSSRTRWLARRSRLRAWRCRRPGAPRIIQATYSSYRELRLGNNAAGYALREYVTAYRAAAVRRRRWRELISSGLLKGRETRSTSQSGLHGALLDRPMARSPHCAPRLSSVRIQRTPTLASCLQSRARAQSTMRKAGAQPSLWSIP